MNRPKLELSGRMKGGVPHIQVGGDQPPPTSGEAKLIHKTLAEINIALRSRSTVFISPRNASLGNMTDCDSFEEWHNQYQQDCNTRNEYLNSYWSQSKYPAILLKGAWTFTSKIDLPDLPRNSDFVLEEHSWFASSHNPYDRKINFLDPELFDEVEKWAVDNNEETFLCSYPIHPTEGISLEQSQQINVRLYESASRQFLPSEEKVFESGIKLEDIVSDIPSWSGLVPRVPADPKHFRFVGASRTWLKPVFGFLAYSRRQNRKVRAGVRNEQGQWIFPDFSAPELDTALEARNRAQRIYGHDSKVYGHDMIDSAHRQMRRKRRVSQAQSYAKEMHAVHPNKYSNEEPYYDSHLRKVANLVASVTKNVDVIAAAYLHDVMGDTPALLDDMSAIVGNRVATLVDQLTDKSKPSYYKRSPPKPTNRDANRNMEPDVQTIKLAVQIVYTPSILSHDPESAAVYLREQKALLPKLKDGDPTLYERASRLVLESLEQLEN